MFYNTLSGHQAIVCIHGWHVLIIKGKDGFIFNSCKAPESQMLTHSAKSNLNSWNSVYYCFLGFSFYKGRKEEQREASGLFHIEFYSNITQLVIHHHSWFHWSRRFQVSDSDSWSLTHLNLDLSQLSAIIGRELILYKSHPLREDIEPISVEGKVSVCWLQKGMSSVLMMSVVSLCWNA